MYRSPFEQTLRPLLEPTLKVMGYSLLRIQFIESGRRTLQVMAERLDDVPMTVDDCADISHTVSAILDVEDAVSGQYNLQISSPGPNRPLMTLADFATQMDKEIKVEMQQLVGNRKRFRGTLIAIEGEMITLLTDNGEVDLDFGAMQSAECVMTDDMFRELLRAGKKKTTPA